MPVSERQPLTRQRILEAAVKLADRDGLEAVSMRRLGSELGVKAMSLYKHIPNKEKLFEGMVGSLLREIEIDGTGENWMERGRAISYSFRRIAHAHPHVFPLIVAYPPAVADIAPELEAVFSMLREAGFSPLQTVQAFHTITSYVAGFALSEIPGYRTGLEKTDTATQEAEDFSAPSFPFLTEMGSYLAQRRNEAGFEFGLNVIIRGLQALITQPT